MTGRGRVDTKPQSSCRECIVVKVEGLLNYANWLMREVTDGPNSSHPPQNQQSDFDEDLFKEVEAFEGGEGGGGQHLDEIDLYQSDEGDLLTKSNPHRSSTDEGPSTSDTHFVCSNWVSHISIKRLKYFARQFYLPTAILKSDRNDRPHIPPPHMATFSKAIIQGEASIPLHPFIVEVLDYFNVAHFQFTPNSICTIVAFYIAFREVDIGKPSTVEFACICCINALARNKGF